MIFSGSRYSPWRLNIQLTIVTFGAEVDLLPEEIIFTPRVITSDQFELQGFDQNAIYWQKQTGTLPMGVLMS